MKKAFALVAAGAIALTAVGCDKKDAAPAGNATTAAATPAPAGKDWTEQVVATPEGGFRMGNPDAPVKLVEYASLTCPHCADFAKNAVPKLKEEFVKTGQVSWEFRNFVLNPIDVAATLLARCQGAGPVFKLNEQVYAEQENWLKGYSTVSEADSRRIQALPENQQFVELAAIGGLDGFFRARGLPQARAQACLADKKGLDVIVSLRKIGTERDGVQGTPSFLIDGKQAEGVYSWETLEPKLREAL